MNAVERLRTFNRHWTEVLGLLDAGLLGTGFTLPEARVLFELGTRGRWPRAALRARLGADASYLTRLLAGLADRGLVTSAPSPTDGRAVELSLTAAGRRAYRALDRRSRAQVDGLLAPLGPDARARLGEAATTLARLTGATGGDGGGEVALREPVAGDFGWVASRHGALYADEHGWDASFEALVMRLLADFVETRDPARERGWIAEIDGARAGSAFCRSVDAATAQLRMVLVEPWARGAGLGARLVDEAMGFARATGHDTMVLWTNDVLAAARRLYESRGFELVGSEPHESFGRRLVGQRWSVALG